MEWTIHLFTKTKKKKKEKMMSSIWCELFSLNLLFGMCSRMCWSIWLCFRTISLIQNANNLCTKKIRNENRLTFSNRLFTENIFTNIKWHFKKKKKVKIFFWSINFEIAFASYVIPKHIASIFQVSNANSNFNREFYFSPHSIIINIPILQHVRRTS